MKRLFFTIMMLTACGSSGPSYDVTVPIPLTVTSYVDNHTLDRAFEFWANALGEEVFEVEVDPEQADITIYHTEDPIPCGEIPDASGCASVTPDHCLIRIWKHSSMNPLIILSHELGHCLGLPHDNNPSSIMQSFTE